MTKLSEDNYECEWCGRVFTKKVYKYISPGHDNPTQSVKGKQNVTNQLTCPNIECLMLVSQRTKYERSLGK